MIPEPTGSDHGRDAGPTIDAILANASSETRATIRVLGELLGQQPVSALSPTAFAMRHLGVAAAELTSEKFTGPGTSLSILGNLLRIEMERHAGRVVVGSPGDGLPANSAADSRPSSPTPTRCGT